MLVSESEQSQKTIESESIQEWLIAYLAQLLDMDPGSVDVTRSFGNYGLDSSATVGMTGDLEDWLGVELDPTLVYDYPTIEQLTGYLTQEFNG